MALTSTAVHSEQLRSLLKKHFGFDSFLPMQEEIVAHVLSGRDGLVLMPTGGGKSLCYQLTALALDGVTIVVSPLIALMKDQVDGLKANGVPAEFLNSTLTHTEAGRVRSLAIGGALKVLYIAPERLATPGFSEFMRALNVGLLAIDEAHCISEWGHDFRPDYRNLKALRNGRDGVPMLALTATATPRVRDDIIRQLELREQRTFLASFNRPNLVYRVEPKNRSLDRLLSLLRNHSGESAIVYCFSRKETERVAGDLRANGINALPYHAGLGDAVRGETQERFIRDNVQVIAATIAFGMGIDKPDVRLIVHNTFPKTIEGYYQETGRAGRDGLPSECVLFYSYGDKRNHDYFINRIEDASERRKAELKLRQVIDFCQSAVCRRRSVLPYFGEQWSEENCGACDVCLASDDQADVTEIAQKILSAVIRTGQRFGAGYVIDVLRGSRSSKVIERGHDQLSVHGITRDHSAGDLRHVIAQLAARGLLALGPSDYPTYRVTAAGKEFLHSRESLFLARPSTAQSTRTDNSREDLEYDSYLFQKLRELRKRIADEKGVPAYIVFGDRPLQQMARYYPQRRDTFLHISGVGEAKLEQYGEDFLQVIREYAKQHELHELPIPQTASRPMTAQSTRTDNSREDLEYDSHLFQKLRELRKRIADEKGVPPYIVFGDRPLQQMARYYPQRRDTFLHISGVGEAKLEQYGEDFLQVIREYAKQHELHELPIPQTARLERRSARAPSQTHIQTKNLLRQGLSIEEVAKQRGIAKATVIGHVQRLVESDEGFDISEWLPPLERRLSIEAAFRETGSMLLGPVRERLGDDYSYEEIRLVRLSLTRQQDSAHTEPGGSPPPGAETDGQAGYTLARTHVDQFLSAVMGVTVTGASPDPSSNDKVLSEIEKVLVTLQGREAHVLRLRFGLADGRGHTLQEIGERLGVSRERVRQIEHKALRKLRHPTRRKLLEALADNNPGLRDAPGSLSRDVPAPIPGHGSSHVQQVREPHPRA